MSDDKRCGTCRWWKARETTDYVEPVVDPWCGYCVYPRPGGLPNSFSRAMVWSDENDDCPCHERKERNEREGAD